MLAIRPSEKFSQTEVNNIDEVLRLLSAANQEIIGFNISVDYTFLVSLLDTFDHLGCANADSFQIKLMLTSFEQRFKRGTQQVHNHDMELITASLLIGADIIQLGNVG